MTKLVNEDVVGELGGGSDRAVKIEDAAATVSPAVNEHFDKLVRRELRGPTQRAVVECQHVSFRSKRIVSRAEWRVAIDTGRRSRDPRLRRRRTHCPDIKAPAILFERRRREEPLGETARISFKLLRFGSRVAIAENQKVNTVFRLARFLYRDQGRGRHRLRAIDKLIRRIDRRGPDVLEDILRVAFL